MLLDDFLGQGFHDFAYVLFESFRKSILSGLWEKIESVQVQSNALDLKKEKRRRDRKTINHQKFSL